MIAAKIVTPSAGENAAAQIIQCQVHGNSRLIMVALPTMSAAVDIRYKPATTAALKIGLTS
jgi:hypothetical protein